MAKNIKSNERLIVALDFDNIELAKNLVDLLGETVVFYKLGLELMMSSEYFELIKWLESKNKKVFADLKLFDISNTVGKAIKNLSSYSNIEFVTIHVASKDIMNYAVNNRNNLKILAVTILTNLDSEDLTDMGFDSKIALEDLVLKRMKLAYECKVNGVVCSGLEAKLVRQNSSEDFLIVTPGIRPDFLENQGDDQKRVVDVKKAFQNGADYIVVGRPISKSSSPKSVATKIQEQIAEIFSI